MKRRNYVMQGKPSSGQKKASPTHELTIGSNVFEPVPQLPHDVIDIVIGFLQCDRLSLLQCSLVCRTWAHSTAIYLFRRRRWPKCEHFWTKKRSVPNCFCSREEPRLRELRVFLLGSQRIRSALQNIELRFNRVPGGARPDGGGYMPMGCVNVEELMDVFDTIPNLRSIRLSGIYGHSWPTKNRSAGQATRKLDTLEISDAIHLDSSSCAALVSYFGKIRFVFLDDVNNTLPEDLVHTPLVTAGSSCVQSFDFSSLCRPSSVSKYLKALKTVINAPLLAQLSLDVPNERETVERILSFLDIATNLESSRFRTTLDLRPSSSTLTGFASFDDWSSLAQCVRHCSARTVEIELTLCPRSKDDSPHELSRFLREWDWRLLDTAAGSRSRLEVLRITIKIEIRRAGTKHIDLGGIAASCENFRVNTLRHTLSDRLFALLDIAVV